MARNQIDSFIDTYVQALHDQNAAVFAGAGLSIPAGFVNWKELMRDIAEDIGLDVDKEDDLITVAQFHMNERGGRHGINQALINEFSKRGSLTENHRILANLPIRTFWTTNYDTLIEKALQDAHKTPDIKISVENLATTVPRRDAVVYKMHGDISQSHKAVVTKDDYEAYNETRQLFSTALQGDLVSKTFLFVGFSFSDPNLAYILSRIRVLLGANRREHYCLLRKVHKKDFKVNRDFEYARAKQELQVKDLQRYGIIGLLVDKYDDYPEILMRIAQKYKMSRVFISGSASTYTPWKDDNAQYLIRELSRELVKKGFGIVSGFGLGVGDHVINGVLDQLDREGTRQFDDRVVLRPFPYKITDPKKRTQRWTAYREEMLAHAGIAIFLFGNKNTASGVMMADGMLEEFKIAIKRGLAVVPVGCTGSMAELLHKRVLNKLSHYYPHASGYKRLLKDLALMGSPTAVVARVIEFVNKLKANA